MRRAFLTVSVLAAFFGSACGYADPYAGSPPVANESPNPSASPSVSPGVDDFGTCYNAKGVTFQLTVNTGTGFFNGSTTLSSGNLNILCKPGY